MNNNLYRKALLGNRDPKSTEFSPITSLSLNFNEASLQTPVSNSQKVPLQSPDALELDGEEISINKDICHRRLSTFSTSSDESDLSFSIPSVSGTPIRENIIQSSPFVCSKNNVINIPAHMESPKIKLTETTKLGIPKRNSKRILFDCTNTQRPAKQKRDLSIIFATDDESSENKPYRLPSTSKGSENYPSTSSKKASLPDQDEFMVDLLSLTPEKENSDSPLNSLISLPINSWKSEERDSNRSRLLIRRCLSMFDNSTPLSSQSKRKSPCRPAASRSNKRPASPMPERIEKTYKRVKYESESSETVEIREIQTVQTSSGDHQIVQRCLSESHVSIMRAVTRSTEQDGPQLTGDFSRPVILPVLQGARHPDLKSIDVHTLANLIKGHYKENVESYSIFDCRYPYEYVGGHIKGAINWPHPQNVLDFMGNLVEPPQIPDERGLRKIYIFHCEFSAERGPKAQRLLREIDRSASKEYYPALYYPELYLLEGGYKAFYEAYPELCSPFNYVKMIDENHTEDFKIFRAKSKVWATENKHGKLKSIVSKSSFNKL